MHHSKDHDYSVTVARTVEEVLALQETWDSFNPIPVASLPYFLAQLETNQHSLGPYVMVLRRQQKVEGMLVARVEEKYLEFKFGHKVLLRSKVRSISLVDGGVLGEASAAHCQAYFAELLGSLRRKEADVAFFEGIRNDSSFYDSGLQQPEYDYGGGGGPLPSFTAEEYKECSCYFNNRRNDGGDRKIQARNNRLRGA